MLMPQAAPPIFRSVPPSESKIDWIHDNGRSAQRYLPETLGPGVAIFDYNADGWVDILFTNGGPSAFYRPTKPSSVALYRNNHDGTFTDVAQTAGLKDKFFGIGAAAGDYDADGFPDIYITGFERSYLYHNRRDGTFVDVTA